MICLPYFLSAVTSFTENISNNSHDDKEREQDSYLHILLFEKYLYLFQNEVVFIL